jgi:hypothetical protein
LQNKKATSNLQIETHSFSLPRNIKRLSLLKSRNKTTTNNNKKASKKLDEKRKKRLSKEINIKESAC